MEGRLPAVPGEASCCITAVSLERRWRRSEVRRLLDAQQAADASQNLRTQQLVLANQVAAPQKPHPPLCCYRVPLSVGGGVHLLAAQDVAQPGQSLSVSTSELARAQLALAGRRSRPHVGGGTQEGADAGVGRRPRVGGTRLAVVPVGVPGQGGQVHVHLVHGQQRHLDTEKQEVTLGGRSSSGCEDRDWLLT